jgi:cysteine desulfurase / selenocysteine lyase
MTTSIYLDNAATSFPKPEAVYAAMDYYHRSLGAPVGRGAYQAGMDVQAIVRRCRKRAAEFLGAANANQIIFTFNGTDSLNLALHGLLKPGDHVVTSAMEHNSILRPLRWLEKQRGIEVSIVPADPKTGRIEPADIRKAIRPNTRLIAMIHASNVTGTIQPIADVAEIAKAAGKLFLVDAAQSAGHVPIHAREQGIDLLACPGHKGLLGPLGTGLLYLKPGLEDEIESTRQGGTGSQSEEDYQPERLPDKYESGNHNAPGLVGLEAGLAWLANQDPNKLRQHEMELTSQFLEGLNNISTVQIQGPNDPEQHVGVVSITVEGYEPQVLASILDENFQIQIRSGLHCAPLAHRMLGTLETGGTARFSFGPFTTKDHIEAAVNALKEIADG